jgi:hypothetical protein
MSSRDEDVKNPRLFDRRVVERNIKKGLITRKDYEKHLKSLSDVAGNIASADERAEEAIDDIDDDEDDELESESPPLS